MTSKYLFLCLALLFSAIGSVSALEIRELKVNNLISPLGVDTLPHFRWLNASTERNKRQTAYRIILSASEQNIRKNIGDLWDSGKVKEEDNFDVPYAGTSLLSRKRYFWRVMTWDEKNIPSDWSGVAAFETGILHQDEWKSAWIGAGESDAGKSAPILRRIFSIQKEVVRARVYIAGLGLFTMTVNGSSPDDSVLNPAHTQYNKRINYKVFDITSLLRTGANVIRVELGNGFFYDPTDTEIWNLAGAPWRQPPRMRLELLVEYHDGSCETILSDRSWKLRTDGPCLFNSMHYGEVYDARKHVPAESTSEFDTSSWSDAQIVEPPAGKLVWETIPPMRKINSFRPEIKRIGNNRWLLKAPRMLTGWARITFRAPGGEEILISYGEQLNAGGTLKRLKYTDKYKRELQQYRYITRGDGPEIYEPSFSYNGYEYIQIDNYSGELRPEDVICYQINSDLELLSSVETGDGLVNRIHQVMINTMYNNFHGKPTDCPVFEKMGWTGDSNVAMETFAFNCDISSFIPLFMDGMADAMRPDGTLPFIIPSPEWGYENGSAVWSTVYQTAATELLRKFGLRSVMVSHYEAMRRLTLRLVEVSRYYKWTWTDHGFSDWVAPDGPNSPPEGNGICGSGFLYRALGQMAEMASLMGRPEDRKEYLGYQDKIRQAFQRKFFIPGKQIYDTGIWFEQYANGRDSDNRPVTRSRYRQTSNLVPLAFGLVPEKHRRQVFQNLLRNLESRRFRLDTGIVGSKLLLNVLSEMGYPEFAYRILINPEYPGWGNIVSSGATSFYEGWTKRVRSLNHFFLGTCDEWLFVHIAGIQKVSDGYRHLVLQPKFLKTMKFADISTKTVRGLLRVRWIADKGKRSIWVWIPVGATAELYIPAPVSKLNSVPSIDPGRIIRRKAGETCVTLGSGKYYFEFP